MKEPVASAGAGVVAGGVAEGTRVPGAKTAARPPAGLGDDASGRGGAAGGRAEAWPDTGVLTGGGGGGGGSGKGEATGTAIKARSGMPSVAFPDPFAETGVITATICNYTSQSGSRVCFFINQAQYGSLQALQ
jgi:hypothetical protein